jgi:hypothetical protein
MPTTTIRRAAATATVAAAALASAAGPAPASPIDRFAAVHADPFVLRSAHATRTTLERITPRPHKHRKAHRRHRRARAHTAGVRIR